MSWFAKKPCAACAARDSHLESLKSEVASLRRLVVPPASQETLTPAAREADLILNPDDNHTGISDAEYEAASIMSGNHERWQVEVG